MGRSRVLQYSNDGALTIGAAHGVTSDVRLERVAVRHSGGAGISVERPEIPYAS